MQEEEEEVEDELDEAEARVNARMDMVEGAPEGPAGNISHCKSPVLSPHEGHPMFCLARPRRA